jgi:hypothetical protein
MGLDCTAYEKVTLVEAITLEQLKVKNWEHPLYDDEAHCLLYNKDFPERSDGLVEGFYLIEGKSKGFRAGSYSGYMRYRQLLAQIVGAESAEKFWREPEKLKDKPFYEQINFADNEGFLGPETCKLLLADYKEMRPKAMALFEKMFEEDKKRIAAQPPSPFSVPLDAVRNWTADVYDDWIEAFEIAAGAGVIRFH